MFKKVLVSAGLAAALSVGFVSTASAVGLEVGISSDIESVDISYGGKPVTVQRNQDVDHVLTGGFTKTSRPCPPFCFQPMSAGEGVETLGEVEMAKFLRDKVETGKGVLIDARTPEWYKSGTIPGSINVPFTVFNGDPNRDRVYGEALQFLGAKKGGNMISEWMGNSKNGWDFTDAKEIALFCNGPWCGQSPRAISGLLNIGYPAAKIKYYRGGMQLWQIGSFTVTDAVGESFTDGSSAGAEH